MIFQEILNVRLFLEISLQLQLYSQALLANSACDMQKKKNKPFLTIFQILLGT